MNSSIFLVVPATANRLAATFGDSKIYVPKYKKPLGAVIFVGPFRETN